MLKKFESFFLDILNEKRKGIFPFFIKIFLHILSWLFGCYTILRNYSYDKGWCRRYFPPSLVLSVGNIVAGGTGKTPIVLLLANRLCHLSPTAILSRGYRSPTERLSTPVTLSLGQGPLYPCSYCGDEPYLLAQNVKNAAVFVGRDRQKASVLATKWGAKALILDDGMQYRQLARDFEIVVIDASDPFGKGYFLPRGFLRERPQELSRAHLLIANHIKNRAHYLTIKHQLSRYSGAPLVGTSPIISSYFDLKDNPISSLKEKKIGMYCGIAKPDHFRRLLQKEGALVVAELVSADHTLADQDHFHLFIQQCQKNNAAYIVCTEKDRVKMGEGYSSPIPIVWVRMDLQITEGEEYFNQFINQIQNKLRKMEI